MGKVFQPRGNVADKGIPRIFALWDRGNDQARRTLRRHVFQAMNRTIDFTGQQGFFDFLGEQPFAADFQKPAVLHTVTRGADHDQRGDLVGVLQIRSEGRDDRALHRSGLNQRKLRASGANPDGRLRGHGGGVTSKGILNRLLQDETQSRNLMTTLTLLGIETSCDETAAAVVRRHGDGRVEVLSNVIASQIAAHAPYGGVVPEIAARAHVESIDAVVGQAMTEAGVDYANLSGVAATAGPGLIGGVMVGLAFGKAVALARNLPLIAVNHLEGHAVSARLATDVAYPFLLLLVSGGHCQLLVVEGVGRCRRLGTTIDDAAGEAFDKIAKSLGLPYPGGPALERLAALGDPGAIGLPVIRLEKGGLDFSFSGLKSAAARLAATLRSETDVRNLAAAAQAAIAWQLRDRTERAMKLYAASHGDHDLRFVVAGGVAANGKVRAELLEAAKAQDYSFTAPPLIYCTDNAAMIALAGAERLALGLVDPLDASARPRWPLDAAMASSHPSHLSGRKGVKA